MFEIFCGFDWSFWDDKRKNNYRLLILVVHQFLAKYLLLWIGAQQKSNFEDLFEVNEKKFASK